MLTVAFQFSLPTDGSGEVERGDGVVERGVRGVWEGSKIGYGERILRGSNQGSCGEQRGAQA